ncbi:MAG: M28 family peptidase [Acidobacteriota bacterium]
MRQRGLRIALMLVTTAVVGLHEPHGLQAQAPAPATGVRFAQISEADARTWLTYLSSDLMQGRQVFTEGYGLAASYIAGELKALGVKPLGDNGSYLQAVTRRGYRVTRNSTVTIEVGGVAKTFRQGEHISMSTRSGGRQTLRFTEVQFVGNDHAFDTDAAKPAPGVSRLAVYYPSALPARIMSGDRVRRPTNLDAALMKAAGGAGVMGFGAIVAPPVRRDDQSRSGRPAADLTSVQRVDRIVPPSVTADDTVFEWLFSKAPTSWTDLRGKASSGVMPSVTLRDVNVTVTVDNTFDVITTERTENVVGMVEGTDPVLKNTYVFFGAHLDHVGYVKNEDESAHGRVNVPVTQDAIWNGADDDGSGSAGVLAIAKAFVTGPKPKRSVVFVWHAGEEAGLIGSTYMADYPVVPLDTIQAELNIDMIGRNRDNNPSQADTLYVIGADRISTDLHNLLVETNRRAERPLTLDYEFNDAADPNSFYTRSDHYSYASKGIPIAFFFTGEHPDYHANTDSVEKILFPKLVRIAQFIYQAGFAIANSERALERDNLGPRAGKGFSGGTLGR